MPPPLTGRTIQTSEMSIIATAIGTVDLLRFTNTHAVMMKADVAQLVASTVATVATGTAPRTA